MGPVSRTLMTALAIAAWSLPAGAQTAPQRTRLDGLTLDHWQGAAGPALIRPTLRLTRYTGGGPGPDFAVVFFPDGFSLWPTLLRVGLQAGVAQPVAVGPVTLLVKGGAAGIATASLLGEDGFFDLVPGVQGGIGLLIPVDRKSSLRLEVSRHVYRTDSSGRNVWSFGFGVTSGGRR